MNWYKIKWLLLSILLAISIAAKAETITAPLLSADWKVNQSKTLCQMEQEINHFGKAGFYLLAGEPLIFSFKEYVNRPGISQASLYIEPAPWRNNLTDRRGYPVFLDDFGQPTQQGRLNVYGDVAETMLKALLQGRYPVFDYLRHTSEIRVAVSTIKFSKAYQQFIDCRKQLLPFGKKQLQQASLFFDQNSKFLNQQTREHLNQVANYLKAIKGNRIALVSATAMVGKTDHRWFNKRAKIVSKKLIQLGIAATRISINNGQRVSAKRHELILKLFGPDSLRFFYYRKGNTHLNSKEKKRLDLLIQYINKYFHNGQLVISSHTDSKGSRSHNLKVSRQRGKVIKQYLANHGVSAQQIHIKAFGESRPIKSNRFPTGRAQNRRVVISLLKDKNSLINSH